MLGFSPGPPKPVDRKKEKIMSLFSMNPFETLRKNQKTLIATPSKFEIRNEPEPVKRGRGRPRKDDNAILGLRDKLNKAKTEDGSVRKVGRPPKDINQASKRIDKEKIHQVLEKAQKRARIQKRKEREAKLKDLERQKKQEKRRKIEEKKAKLKT